jgi:aspartate aminotransferase-like enzyme
MIFQLDKSLDHIIEEGLENVWARHAHFAKAVRAAVQEHGLTIFSKSPSVVCTTIDVPDGVDGGAIVKTLKNKRGIFIAGGQEHLKGKIFRIATLGSYDIFDVVTVLTGVEITLRELGYDLTLGKGIGAALEILKDPIPENEIKTTVSVD